MVKSVFLISTKHTPP